jgi:hypothetical protein
MLNPRVWVLLLACFVATPALAQTPQTSDRAYHLVGKWSCEDINHTLNDWTIVRRPDGSLTLRNVYHPIGGGVGRFDETYRFDAKIGRWTWHSHDGSSFAESGTAGRWISRTWTFEGVADALARSRKSSALIRRKIPVRMVYTDLGNDALQREFLLKQPRDGSWASTSLGTCKRI